MKTFSDLTSYNKYLNLPSPLHPLMDSRVCKQAIPNFPQTSDEIQVNLFKISLKKNFTGDINYGQNKYYTENGLMLFSEPGQVVSWDSLTFWDGYAFVFHPDLLKQNPIAGKINQYKYFSYEINDALFMTAEEEEIITWLFTRIHYELLENREHASINIVLSLLNVVLSYSEAFYERQYKDKATKTVSIAEKVKHLMQKHYKDFSKPVASIPTVSAVAEELNLTPNYLTDMIRAETGKSTITIIQEFVVDQAEILLLQTDMNISDVAYQLGFTNLPYFSRFFKKIKGISPSEVRSQAHKN
ncbi:AraC family transcriptional activator of pobA [Chryseobacterium ginsenosidimutans]|uniref:helix-turn-helix domain-containing protein n=1 Tax=Chryseobacterium ginsenosidimutans TaxID=687846 RepID=UPI00277DA073|nr:AraC family transcriptional regulator [Chryseobacterium ginsenosidimutans]MDQ0593631.1 AraC family transcriptional activator of pobA [Chryseobacterium ginsenosidimutans]